MRSDDETRRYLRMIAAIDNSANPQTLLRLRRDFHELAEFAPPTTANTFHETRTKAILTLGKIRDAFWVSTPDLIASWLRELEPDLKLFPDLAQELKRLVQVNHIRDEIDRLTDEREPDREFLSQLQNVLVAAPSWAANQRSAILHAHYSQPIPAIQELTEYIRSRCMPLYQLESDWLQCLVETREAYKLFAPVETSSEQNPLDRSKKHGFLFLFLIILLTQVILAVINHGAKWLSP